MLLLIGVQLVFACPENHVEIWLAFLFLSREKCHAKQICVLSSAIKLAPVHSDIQSFTFKQVTIVVFVVSVVSTSKYTVRPQVKITMKLDEREVWYFYYLVFSICL